MTETEMVLKREKRISVLAVKERTLARRLVHRDVAMANWKGKRETRKYVLRRPVHEKERKHELFYYDSYTCEVDYSTGPSGL
jgi:hypothetical protein